MMNSGAPMIGSGQVAQDGGQRHRVPHGRRIVRRGVRTLERHRGHALGAVDDGVALARRLGQQVLGIEARGGDLGVHEAGVALAVARAGPRPPAARAPSASRRPGCRPASGTAPSRRTRRSGLALPCATTKSTTSTNALRAAPQALAHRSAPRRCRARASSPSVSAICAAIALATRAAVARGLAADQVVGLDRRRAFVDRQDARVAVGTAPRRSPR